jgi:phosphoribosylformylglycinamidine synthase subunit PurL
MLGDRPPAIDLGRELSVQEFVLTAAGLGLLRSAHDLAEGGLLVTLAECCLAGGLGLRCPPLPEDGELSLRAAFFAESQSRFVVSIAPRSMPELQSLGRRLGVELLVLGMIGGEVLEFEGQLRVPLDEIRAAYDGALA